MCWCVEQKTEGWLKKLTSRRVTAFASWQKRFFRVSTGSPAALSYWRKGSQVDKSPSAGSWLCADMLRCLVLSFCLLDVVRSVETHPKDPLRFNIVLKNRTIQLQGVYLLFP